MSFVPGFFGSECDRRCPQHCPGGGYCHRIFGYCECLPGLFGTACNKPCPDGTWGPNCIYICNCSSKHASGCDPKVIHSYIQTLYVLVPPPLWAGVLVLLPFVYLSLCMQNLVGIDAVSFNILRGWLENAYLTHLRPFWSGFFGFGHLSVEVYNGHPKEVLTVAKRRRLRH